MSRHDVAVLTLRAFAIYAWFEAFEYFAGGMMSVMMNQLFSLSRGVQLIRTALFFVPSLLFLAMGWFLFLRSKELASWLLPLPSDAAEEPLPPHPLPTASVAFAVVGLAIFLYAAPRLLTQGITLAEIIDPKERMDRFTSIAPQVIGNAVQVILGFLLFVKSRTFATAWWRKQQL